MVDKLSANCAGDIFYFDDYSMLNHDGATWAWTFENANITTSNLRNPEVFFTSSGTHTVTLTVTNNFGISSSDTLTIAIEDLATTEIEQDFEVQLLPEGWTQETTGTFNWTYNNTVGGFGLSTNSMVVNNYEISQEGNTCDIIAPINMSSLSASDAILSFDVAYARYSPAYQDGLEVLVSTDCGASYTSVYTKIGAELATAPDTTNQFEPTNDQWRTESIDLSSYIENSTVYINFRNINGFGQALYVDNIQLGSNVLSVESQELEAMLLYPNPVSSDGSITIKTSKYEDLKFSLFSVQGKQILKLDVLSNTQIRLDGFNLSTGLYLYTIKSANQITKGKLLVSGLRH